MTQDDAEPGHDGERRTPLWSRGGVLTLWIILGALFCGAVGHLIGQALPGDIEYGAGIGIGAGVALGIAVGTRRADANDREIARRAEDADDRSGQDPSKRGTTR